ncbi:FkbW [Alloactinosynnema sp. L-07]|uniref:tannase/feruloyl esterase family alpha/beta hydrolase n=1 Tax=Alloactinosynnema sp. L-07 TaxID=1653480 RepID=UPI00065F0169|nr:tannase/feruloyl esterase family alpha/beta hydrolase [Alloactinosynnema sp. L-07]CRK56527.1 FkbW [Alloactinosynnema sp. L-07]
MRGINSRTRRVGAIGLAAALAVTLVPAAAAAGRPSCSVAVLGAEKVTGVCLADLTTAGTVASGHTDPADWAGLEAPGTVNPSGVPGIQLDGYFPDTSTTNTNHGWNHDSQFVIRLPAKWNGGLVVAGPPGTREQYANDRIIGDHVLAKGYAFAATDKGNTGPELYRDGRRPGDAIMEWHFRVTQLTIAAKFAAARHYGRAPKRTYAAGTSAGGYLVRWQLEHYPWLYDGGVDWNGLLFTPQGPNLLTSLPPALRAYPRFAAGEPGAKEAMVAAGYPAESAPVWAFHHRTQWDLFQRILREELDPDYDGDTQAGTPFCAEGTGPGCDTDYDYARRPAEVHDAMRRVSLTGKLTRPLITVHGTYDALVTISRSSDVYAELANDARHRYYRVEGGHHTDGLAGAFPTLGRTMLPCFRGALDAMTAWVERGTAPPPSRTIPAGVTCAP